jgi:hypothetical protein
VILDRQLPVTDHIIESTNHAGNTQEEYARFRQNNNVIAT